MTGFELHGVTKHYGETAALDDVSLAVDDGEFFTLVGPSGCGKTTTLRLVAGFETPTRGRVTFDGDDVSGTPPEKRGVGVVFQNYALFPHMSVAENVAYGLRFSEPPGDVSTDERVAELLDLVDLAGFEGREPTALSGGQQQRVALARALAPGPRILLLDEPMSALDAALRERLRGQIKTIQRELGVTTLYVTHDQEEALAVSDRVAVMNGGRVEQVGTPRAIYKQPRTSFVAAFVGDNNLFEGRVTEVGDGTATVDVDGTAFRVAGGEKELRAGATATFAVRPEQLRVVDVSDAGEVSDTSDTSEIDDVSGAGNVSDVSDASDTGKNRLTGVVQRAEFLGETTRVWLDCEGRTLVVRTPTRLDGKVTVAFDADAAVVVSDGEGSSDGGE